MMTQYELEAFNKKLQRENEVLRAKLHLIVTQPEVKKLINKWVELGETRNF